MRFIYLQNRLHCGIPISKLGTNSEHNYHSNNIFHNDSFLRKRDLFYFIQLLNGNLTSPGKERLILLNKTSIKSYLS